MIDDYLLPCPICNKKPLVKLDWQNGGNFCKIRCRTIVLKKPHFIAWQGKATMDRAIKYAIKEWNEKVTNYGNN